MTTDLAMLTASAVLTALLVLPDGLAMWANWRVTEVLGNRETPPPLPPWADRAKRARANMLESRVTARCASCDVTRRGSPFARSAPRVRIELSPRLWLGSFLVTSLIYLVQVDGEGISAGRWRSRPESVLSLRRAEATPASRGKRQ